MIPFGPLPRWATSTSKQSTSQIRCERIICENKPELEVTQLWDLERIGILPESFSLNERETISIVRSVKEARATTRRDSPFQGTWKVNPRYLESLFSSSTFFY